MKHTLIHTLKIPFLYSSSLQARAIRERIGFSENIMNNTCLDQEYQDVSAYKMKGELSSQEEFKKIMIIEIIIIK